MRSMFLLGVSRLLIIHNRAPHDDSINSLLKIEFFFKRFLLTGDDFQEHQQMRNF
jgi:hypothetical protein